MEDTVKQGDPVGECGNSGASAAPKVHYQLQNSAGIPHGGVVAGAIR